MYEHCTHGPLPTVNCTTGTDSRQHSRGGHGATRLSSPLLGHTRLADPRRFNQVDDSTVARFRYLTHDISRVTSFDNGIL